MAKGPLVFVDVDTQRDFLEPAGALFVAGSTAILPNLARLTGCARERGIPVLATACAHTLAEPDPEPFAAHCLVGTRGQERVEATAWPGSRVVGPDESFAGDLPPHLTLQKRRYDVFSHPDAERIVALYGRDHPTFVVYGVATDYCVKAAVVGLRDRGHRVAVVVDAVRAVDAAGEADVLTGFARRGAVLTRTEVICRAGGGST
jgi:nicotinamidase/pyrazinamidase